MKNRLFVALPFAILILASVLVGGLTASVFVQSSFAQTIAPGPTTDVDNSKVDTDYYGCGEVGRIVHCDPLLNEFESDTVKGTVDTVYPVTRDDGEFVHGILGKALRFHAYFGEYLNITDTPKINPEQFSISFWAKKDPDFENYAQVISHADKDYESGWTFDTINTTSQSIGFSVFNSNGTAFATNGAEMPENAFVHIVGTFDGSTVRLYRNSVLDSEVKFAGNYVPDPMLPIKIAMASARYSNPWAGVIDDLRIYNRAISQQEVTALFNNSQTNKPISGLVGYWTFDNTFKDESGNKNDAALVAQTSGMVFAPDGRLFFNVKNTGKIMIMKNDTVLSEPFAIVPNLKHDMEEGLLGIALDPNFETNHYLYVYYTVMNNNTSAANAGAEEEVDRFNRIVRFTDNNGVGTDMKILLDNIPAAEVGMHSGGALAFGIDGKLYATIGDAYEPNLSQSTASLLGKVLRINSDGSIPGDNPIPGSPIYTMGHRSMYGITFDNEGNGIITENGDETYDEINLLIPGGNYGYPTAQPPNIAPEKSTNDTAIKPIRSYWKTIAPAQTIYYDGDKFPDLKGKFLVASYNSGRLFALELTNNGTSKADIRVAKEIKIEFPYEDTSSTIAIAQSPSGDIYFGAYYIYKLKSVDMGSAEPNLVPVTISHAPGYKVNNVYVDDNNATMILDVSSDASNSQTQQQAQNTTVKVPRAILDGVTSVAGLDDQGQRISVDFAVDNSQAAYSMVRIANDGSSNISRLIIQGSIVGILAD